MNTIIKPTLNMCLFRKNRWIRKNCQPMPFEMARVNKSLKRNFEFLVLFSNGSGRATGSLIYGISVMDSIPILKLISVSADDVFGGGPTQNVIDDFLRHGLDKVFETTGYSKLVFKIKDIYIFDKEAQEIPTYFKNYYKDTFDRLKKETNGYFSISQRS